jgi:hypothetical protein
MLLHLFTFLRRMYFAILGRHPKLSLAEFALVPTTSLRRQGEYLFFESDLEEVALLSQLEKLGGIVKRGRVIKKPDSRNQISEEKDEKIASFLDGVTIIGVNDQKLGMETKKLYGVRRFKLVELTSSDLEIKNNGKELIALGGWDIGLVLWRQDIAHFELIDFGKPAHGMEVGMMPAKLAQMLVNIGVVQKIQKNQNIQNIQRSTLYDSGLSENSAWYTVYDPFCGFGTTGFVANSGSGITSSDRISASPERRKMQNDGKKIDKGQVTKEQLFTVFKHDVAEPFDHPVVKKVDVIVTEGWLGPVVGRKTREPELLGTCRKNQCLIYDLS